MTSLATLLDLVVNTWILGAVVMSIFWGVRGVFLFATDTAQALEPTSFRKRHPNWERFFQGTYQFIFGSSGFGVGHV